MARACWPDAATPIVFLVEDIDLERAKGAAVHLHQMLSFFGVPIRGPM